MNSPEEDDLAALIGQYSMPSMPGSSSESLLTQSQYAKVIFHDLLPVYPTDADIWCRYTVTEGVRIRHGDRVALYRVGWISVHDHVQFEMAPVPSEEPMLDRRKEDSEFQVLFKASTLPKDASEFYQLCYVNVDSSVCGASVPFQFRRPVDEELCEVEEQEGLLVVRSRTAINEDKLRDATSLIEELEKKNADHERRITDLSSIKDKLAQRLDQLVHIERHEMRLHEDIQALDSEKSELSLKLCTSGQRIDQLGATIEALNADKANLASLLKTECSKQRADNSETERLVVQLDNMQQMLDACTQSKEMASQALHCEQSKVMRLNIEHDKYKYRCGCLEEENAALVAEVTRWQENTAELKSQVERNLSLLQSKTDSHAALAMVLDQRAKEHNEVKRELQEVAVQYQSALGKVKERDDQIARLVASLERAEHDVKNAKEEVDALRMSVASLMTKHRPEKEDLQHAQGMIKAYERNIKRLCEENARLTQCQVELELAKQENAKLSAVIKEHEKSAQVPELDEWLSSSQERLKGNQMCSLKRPLSREKCLQMGSTEISRPASEDIAQAVCNQRADLLEDSVDAEPGDLSQDSIASTAGAACSSPLANLKKMLFKAEECNASLKTKLGQIGTRKPGGNTESARITTLDRAKASVELQLAESNTRQQEARHRLNQIARRLAEIDRESEAARKEKDSLAAQNLAEANDLRFLNQRMESLQQQVLREDEFQGMERESEEVNRLERMSKRAHDLEAYVYRSSTALHDATQIVLVLEAEKESLVADAAALEQALDGEAGTKCFLLEKLVEIDRKVMVAREEEGEERREAERSAKLDQAAEDLYIPEADFQGFSMMMDASQEKVVDISTGNDGGNQLQRKPDTCVNRALGNGDPAEKPVDSASMDTFVTKSLLENLPEPCGSGEAELHLRLELAAAEYRKVYIEKLKAEKKLARMQKKCSNMSISSEGSVAEPTVENLVKEFVCPICAATFPLTEPEPFTHHFEDHLS